MVRVVLEYCSRSGCQCTIVGSLFSRSLTVVFVELVNLLSLERWLFTALIVFFVIVRVWGLQYCEMSGFDSFPKLKMWQN